MAGPWAKIATECNLLAYMTCQEYAHAVSLLGQSLWNSSDRRSDQNFQTFNEAGTSKLFETAELELELLEEATESSIL